MYPLVYHEHLTIAKWVAFSKGQQLLMIASELWRAGKWMDRNDAFAVRQCDERAFELIDLTLEDPKWRGKMRELCRFRELLADRYHSQSMDLKYNQLLYRVLLQMDPESEKILANEEGKNGKMDEINEKFWQLPEAYTYALKEKLGEKLVSVVLFGSVARKEADRFSDVDLIVVCHDLPRTRLSRTEILEEPDRAVEAFLESLWKQGVYTDVIPILKTPEEAEKIVPLYFDLVEDAVILFDRENFFCTNFGKGEILSGTSPCTTKTNRFYSILGFKTQLFSWRNIPNMTNEEIAKALLVQAEVIFQKHNL